MSLIIPLDKVPNQQVTARLDNHRYVITVKDIGDMMAVTIVRDDVTLIENVRAVAGFPLLPYIYQAAEFGNFIFTNTDPENAPYYTDFGSSSLLVYSTTAEIIAASAQ